MRFASLGSGSKGNGAIVQRDRTTLLIDCGFGVKETWARLSRIGIAPEHLDAILATHEHADHSGGIAAFANRFDVPVYGTYGTLGALRGLEAHLHNPFDPDTSFDIGSVRIQPVTVRHDARAPSQFRFDCDGASVGILTDIGVVTKHVVESFRPCTGILMESNHDVGMLMRGPYPAALKRRVVGDFGHLSNEQAAQYLRQILHPALETVVVGHISQQNNAVDAIELAFSDLAPKVRNFVIASQDDGTPWMELNGE